MNGKGILAKGVLVLSVIMVLVLPHQVLRSEDNKQPSDCVNKAFERIGK